MPQVQFKNEEVAAKYETDFTKDQQIHVPGGTKEDGWSGKLSEITLVAADKAFAQGSNVVKLKNAEAKLPPGEEVMDHQDKEE